MSSQLETTSVVDGDMTFVDGLPLPTRRTRKKIVYGTLCFCAAAIGLTTVFGDPANSLHVSAQSWAFGMAGATVFAYVFGAVVDNFNVMRTSLTKSK